MRLAPICCLLLLASLALPARADEPQERERFALRAAARQELEVANTALASALNRLAEAEAELAAAQAARTRADASLVTSQQVVADARRSLVAAELAVAADPLTERARLRAAVESAQQVLLLEGAQLMLDESLAVRASERVSAARAAVDRAALAVDEAQADVTRARRTLTGV